MPWNSHFKIVKVGDGATYIHPVVGEVVGHDLKVVRWVMGVDRLCLLIYGLFCRAECVCGHGNVGELGK